ncbi:MAG TPA: imidazole glycerol phosphate synthase subunit HisH [Bacteroidia bacterium]|jgi:glutamine amidotransferase|nr:imidazole glycerol phosphate synthase subunit HisH [Bacteroidia bacterium]
MKAVIINYHAGNIRSVMFALERIGVNAVLSDNTEEICSADKVVFPGVGEASSAMRYLKEKKLDEVIKNLKQPVFGICLGMQLLCKHSEEGDTDCLGIFDVNIKRFSPFEEDARRGGDIKVPQIGWNKIYDLRSPLFAGIKENEYVYFVHSYYAEKNKSSIASANYITEYCCALQKDNFYAAQFHPEKSAAAGEQMLKNFFAL